MIPFLYILITVSYVHNNVFPWWVWLIALIDMTIYVLNVCNSVKYVKILDAKPIPVITHEGESVEVIVSKNKEGNNQ